MIRVEHGDSRDVLKTLADCSIDSVVTDPPYALVSIQKRFGKPGSAEAKDRDGLYKRASAGFMGQQWDTGEVAFAAEFWAEVMRVLKPGGHVLAFSGTRTYHRMACAIEDAGFEIRDQMAWAYKSGFPKSHDVSKGIDKAAGAERKVIGPRRLPNGRPHEYNIGFNEGPGYGSRPAASNVTAPATAAAAAAWEGWGTALKPAWEPICVARKPLIGTVVANVLQHGTGALNIDGTRIGTRTASTGVVVSQNVAMAGPNYGREVVGETVGRWPANIIVDDSRECLEAFAEHAADRVFYSAKADKDDRLGSKHPTVKPVDLMAYLCRLVTPPGGTVLDPFAGSGTTGMACMREGFNAILIEREAQFVADIKRRIAHVSGLDAPLFGGQDTPPPKPGRRIYGVFADEKLARQD